LPLAAAEADADCFSPGPAMARRDAIRPERPVELQKKR
jgi:hypothetical protein